MLGQVASLLRRFVPYADTHTELSFGPVVVYVYAEEMIRRNRHLEVVAQPFRTAVTAMFASIAMSQVVPVEIMLPFPVVSFQDVWFRRVVQVGHGQFDGRLQGAQVDLHVTGRQFQLRLPGLAVFANGILDQIATEITIDLEQIP